MANKRIMVSIPGEPYALKRHRTRVVGKFASQYDPQENVNWKAYAAGCMLDAMGSDKPIDGPVRLAVYAKFSMPKSRWRKRNPRPMEWHTKRPDLDNIIKAVKDAAKGVLWLDDSQVCSLDAMKLTQQQGDRPGLTIIVEEVAAL